MNPASLFRVLFLYTGIMKASLFTRLIVILIFFSISAFPLRGHTEELSVTEIVENLFSTENAEAKKAFTYISQKKPAEAIPILKSILTSRDNQGKYAVAYRALLQYPITASFSTWIDVLNDSPSFLIQTKIIKHLSLTRDKRIVLPIVQQLSSPFYTVRKTSIQVLKNYNDDRIYPHILNMANSRNPLFRIYSLEAMYHLYDQRLYDLLMEMLKDKNHSVRYYTLHCLEKNDLSKSLNTIKRTAIQDSNPEVRVKAIHIISKSRSYSPYNVLVQCIADSNREVRFAAIEALGNLNYDSTAGRMSSQLYSETDKGVKELIIDTLIRFDTGAGFRGLSKVLLQDSDVMLKVRSAYAMGAIEDRRAIPYLFQGLQDNDTRVVAEVCNALGNYDRSDVIEKLVSIINSNRSHYTRTSALYSLKRIKSKSSLLPLFDRYSREKDPVMKFKLKETIRYLIQEFS